jgi:hypothetical protein
MGLGAYLLCTFEILNLKRCWPLGWPKWYASFGSLLPQVLQDGAKQRLVLSMDACSNRPAINKDM